MNYRLNHRITKSVRVENTSEITESNMALSATSSLFLNTCNDGDSTSLHCPFQCLITLPVKKILPSVQPPLAQHEALSSHPVISFLGEEGDTHLATT